MGLSLKTYFAQIRPASPYRRLEVTAMKKANLGLTVLAALAVYGAKHEVPVGARDFLLAGAVYGILFLVWTLLAYQRYLHARYPRDGSPGVSPYTTAQYALTRTLGYSTVVFSLGGLIWTVLAL